MRRPEAEFLRSLPHDGQSKSCAARFSGARLVHPVEALKNPLQLAFRDANAVVLHDQHRRTALRIGDQAHLSALLTVFYAVFRQIQYQLEDIILPRQNPAVILGALLNFRPKLLGIGSKHTHRLFTALSQIDRLLFRGGKLSAIQCGEI